MVLILLSSIIVALEDITYSSKPLLVDVTFYLDKMLTLFFLIEIFIKMFSMGFVLYFTNGWCWLEFIIGGLCLTDFCAVMLRLDNYPKLLKVNNPSVWQIYCEIKNAVCLKKVHYF